MLASMTSEQLSEWQVFTSRFHALPDPPREAGVIASQMTRLWSGAKTDPEDFVPIKPMPKPVQSAEEGLAALRALGARFQ
jgi:hypothetical protein